MMASAPLVAPTPLRRGAGRGEWEEARLETVPEENGDERIEKLARLQ